MSKNIFEIWKEVGEKVPFAVRRDNWSDEYYTIVESVEIKTWPYGIAKGYATVNGHPSNHYNYDRKWRDNREIPGAGSYQWTYVSSDLVEKKDLPEKKACSPKEPNNAKQYILHENSVLEFGKYKGKTLVEVLQLDASYVKWMLEKTTNIAVNPQAFRSLQLSAGGEELNELTAKINAFRYNLIKQHTEGREIQ